MIIKLAPGERWCCECGNDMPVNRQGIGEGPRHKEESGEWMVDGRICVRCGSPHLVEATSILRPGEYHIVGQA